MEQADFKSSSTLAKSIKTIVSIVGALIVTLYKGPSLLMTATQYNLVLGAILLTIECLSSSAYIITQVDSMKTLSNILEINNQHTITTIFNFYFISLLFQSVLLTNFGAELIKVSFYCLFVAIMTGILSLVMERDPAAWSLLPSVMLLSILFSVSLWFHLYDC